MAAAIVVLEEMMGLRKGPEGATSANGDDDYAHMTTRELSIHAIQATMGLAHEVGQLAGAIIDMKDRLAKDYETKTSRELQTLRARDKWFKRIVTTIVTIVAAAEVLRWLGLEGGHFHVG